MQKIFHLKGAHFLSDGKNYSIRVVLFSFNIELAGSLFPLKSYAKKIFDLQGTQFICCAKN